MAGFEERMAAIAINIIQTIPNHHFEWAFRWCNHKKLNRFISYRDLPIITIENFKIRPKTQSFSDILPELPHFSDKKP